MAFELRQEQRLSQTLAMTPQLQQAIKLLQLSRLELLDEVKEEIETNPILECSTASEPVEPSQEVEPKKEDQTQQAEPDWEAFLDKSNEYGPRGGINFSDWTEESTLNNITQGPEGLGEHLLRQLNLVGLGDEEVALGRFIIGNIDGDGYLRVLDENSLKPDEQESRSLDEISVCTETERSTVEKVLGVIQSFEPAGVGARSTRECLLIQARYLPVRDELVEEVLSRFLPELANKNYRAIATKLGVSFDHVVETARTIVKDLNPMPGSGFGGEEAHAIIPDVYIKKMDGRYVVVQNDNGLPRLKISPYYKDLMSRAAGADDSTRDYIKERFNSAMWLIKSVHQRKVTIFRVVESIVKFQREFLDKGVEFLKPLTLKDVADDIGVHESTVSRVTSNKYADTPRGILRLKYFFSTSMSNDDGIDISVEFIKKTIRGLIDVEDAMRPLSDMKIVDELKDKGIVVSRRTVTKYREAMGVLSSHKRKSYL